jgi:peptide/nickel transport system substrate-binding protein
LEFNSFEKTFWMKSFIKLNFFVSLIIFFAITIISSCNCNKGNDRSQIQQNNDSLSYINTKDADTFYSDWSKQNVLVCHTISEPDMLHPTNGVSGDRSMLFTLLHRFIISIDIQNLTIMPDLVKSLPEISKGELEFTYELKDNIFWDDGTPLTGDDVVFTIKANKCPLTDNPSFKVFLENVKDIVPVAGSSSKFRILMKKPYINNVSFLSDFPIIERKLFDPQNIFSHYSFAQLDDKGFNAIEHADLEKWASEFNKTEYGRDPDKVSGLGPYKLESWESGQSITLVKKKNRNDRRNNDSSSFINKAFPEKIIFKINRDQNSVMLEFKEQAYDLTNFLSTKNLLELKKNDDFKRNYHSGFVTTFNYTYMAMNTKPDGIKHKKLFSDKNVRKAIAMCVPVDDIIEMVDKGKSVRIIGPVSPLKKDFNSELKAIPLDIQKAKILLDSSGWKDTDGDNIRKKMIDGEKVKFEFDLDYYNTVPDWKDIALLIKEYLYKAGIKVNLNPLDVDVLIDKAQNHDFDALLGVWGGNSLPEDFTQLWYTSSWVSKGSNYTGFGNAMSDALIDSIKNTVDDAKRAVMVKRFQKIVYDEQPYVFIKSGVRKVAIHKRFGNANFYYEKPGVLIIIWRSRLSIQDDYDSELMTIIIHFRSITIFVIC